MEENESFGKAVKRKRSEETPTPTGDVGVDLPQKEGREDYEDKMAAESFDDPYAEDANTTGGSPYFAFFAAMIVMSLMLAIWFFAALYFGRWTLI